MNKPVLTIASPPFDDPEADIILRSSDNVDFHVYKFLLSLVSPVFKSMFALPQISLEEGGDGTGSKSVNGRYLPVIPLAEGGEVLGKLLTWCDPRCVPASTAPLDIDIALRLADKYDMEAVANRSQATLRLNTVSHTAPESLSAYAIACTYGFEDIARAAAKGVLRQPVHEIPSVPELKSLSATALHNLYRYHFACSRAMSSLEIWRPADRDLIETIGHDSRSRSCSCDRGGSSTPLGFSLKSWGSKYAENAIAALSERPCGDTVLAQSASWAEASLKGLSWSCSNCPPIVLLTLERFGKALAAEVDRLIDNVSNLLIHSCQNI